MRRGAWVRVREGNDPMGRLVAAVLLGLVVLTGCGGSPEAQESPTVRPVSAECDEAFDEVPTAAPSLAEPAPTAPVSPIPTDPRGAFGDLYGAVQACDSVEEFAEAFRGHPLPITRSTDAVSALRVLCRSTNSEEIRGTAICQEVGVPDTVTDTKENDADLETPESPGG